MVPALSIDSANPGGAPESGKMVEGSAETLPPPVRCASAVGLGASRSEARVTASGYAPSLRPRVTLSIPELGLEHTVDGEIGLS
jgi:hypothetical protein